jgi:hypothetical protein
MHPSCAVIESFASPRHPTCDQQALFLSEIYIDIDQISSAGLTRPLVEPKGSALLKIQDVFQPKSRAAPRSEL